MGPSGVDAGLAGPGDYDGRGVLRFAGTEVGRIAVDDSKVSAIGTGGRGADFRRESAADVLFGGDFARCAVAREYREGE